MKHLKFLFLFIGLAIFASCSESDVEGGVIGDANHAIFSGTIGELQTRVTDNSWDSGDAIGVYALMADQALSDAAIFDGKSNVKYTTSGNGTFTAAGAPINFSETGNLDFVSYYPFKTAITDYKYSIDVTSQSDMAAIDLLYSNNAKGQTKSSPNVDLQFNHMLSKFEMNVQLGEDLTSLEGLTVNIKSVIVDGSLALVDGAITTGTTRKDITPKVSIASGNKTATVAAIVVPGQNLKDVTIVFSLDGKDYEWTPASQELLSTYKYAYTIKLTLDASGEPIVVPVNIGATINDWNDPQIGDTPIVLEPEKEGEDPVAGDKIDIVDFRAAVANGELYTEDKYIEGEVILNPANQVVNNAVAAISDGTAGITLFFGWDDDVVAAMPLGAKVKVGVKDGKWNVYNGLVQFEVNVAKVEIIEETATTPLEPRVATVQDILDGKYQSDLVQISDVQFKDVPATYSGNNALVNSASDEVNVYTRNQATFADDNVPEGNGLFIGVVNHFNNPQLAIRKVDDLAGMTGDRFDDEGGTDPQPGEGDGTKENPYTVAQAFAKQDGSEAWVRGYIVGWKKGSGYNVEFSVENGSASNIAIADSKDETDGTKVIGVQLTNNKPARTDLNLASNPDMYKVEVLLFGNLESYFIPDEGLKNVEEYELVTEGGTDPTPDPIEFTTDKSSVVFDADTELTSTVKLTTDAAQAWTVASDALWLTVAPASGSGNADIVLTATDNTAETSRTATVTITPTANTDLTPIVVNVTQAGSTPLPPPIDPLFPGSDFNDWTTFTSSLNKYGVTFGKESATGGRENSGAMHLEGQHDENAYVFTAVVPEGFSAEGKTMIHFWVKGTAAKSLSLNVYTGSSYKPYNLGSATADVVLEPVASNQYTGTVNTGEEWIKVSLDISTLALSSTPGQNLFALKIGKDADYDLYVDDITIE